MKPRTPTESFVSRLNLTSRKSYHWKVGRYVGLRLNAGPDCKTFFAAIYSPEGQSRRFYRLGEYPQLSVAGAMPIGCQRNPEAFTKIKRIRRVKERLARHQYDQHKYHAKKRGIPFLLTFEQWWELWEPLWHLRGQLPDQYCMARYFDRGGYAVGNVRIITNRLNNQLAAAKTRRKGVKDHAETDHQGASADVESCRDYGATRAVVRTSRLRLPSRRR
jgi:hypothetical protein